jgi:serine/threonine protein kinase/formylglycine-generating enzyme required for sulfatase activity
MSSTPHEQSPQLQAALVPAEAGAPTAAKGGTPATANEVARPELATTQTYVPADTAPGTLIAGRYMLVEKIGEGGMGEVWVAKQSEPVKRKVALKLIKAGMDSKGVVQRFEHERQALALMDHPHIAKVLDGGLTDEFRPFFVMELVNGLPLTRFCDEARLGIRERLELFVPICQAVQHAHQKAIVHRDLKPTNILVTLMDGRPIPKVIDFGVAKATGGKLTDQTLSTQFGAILGTLDYMSPEQAGFSAADVDTRADIYSLGVILYELLTGLRPFDGHRLRNVAYDELIRIMREEEPSKPSTRLSSDSSLPSLAAIRQIEPARLKKLLKGELDWVVMKCLEKQRNRRYETANALARDIQRYLADETVEARPPSTGYRVKKLLWRNKGPVIAASLIFVALIGGIVGTTVGLFEAKRQREEAQKQTSIAEERLHQSVLTAVDAVQNNRGTAVPTMFALLATLPREMIVKELQSRYADVEPQRKLGLAYGLAEYGFVDAGFLCSQIHHSAPDEVDNFVAAFGHDRDASLQAIHDLAAQSRSEQAPRLKARLAIVALHLGDQSIAADMCRIDDRPDPAQRTIFIDESSSWHGNLARLAVRGEKLSDPNLRSAICMAVGSISADRLTLSETTAWIPIMGKWYRAAADNITHSAAGWALRQWYVDLPALATSSDPVDSRDWFVNSLGMTMLKIRRGQLNRDGLVEDSTGRRTKQTQQSATQIQAFYLSDCEVSQGLFQAFLNDPECSNADKPADWQGRESSELFSADPQENVNWYDAVLFCNWLSRTEELEPCYERTEKKQIIGEFDEQVVEIDEWRLAANGSGYRLPTEAEWEYACRAGTSTDFASGTDVELLRRYALFTTGTTQGASPCGSKLPNGWGLFDMHGNVWEWCHDLYGVAGARDTSDSAESSEDEESYRVLRGGSWVREASRCRSADRSRELPDYRNGALGFRVARSWVQ